MAERTIKTHFRIPETVRKRVCLDCLVRCEVNPDGTKASFQPAKKHKMPTELVDTSFMYSYCTHYNPERSGSGYHKSRNEE